MSTKHTCMGRVNDKMAEYAPLAEEVNALGGENVVVPLPGELGLHEALGGKALHGLDDLKVRHIELLVLGGVVVLLGDQHAL